MQRKLEAAETTRDEARVLWPLLALFWIGNIGATMAQVYLRESLDGSRPSLFDLLRWVLPGYVVWLIGAPLVVFFLSRRFSFERGYWLRSAAVHVLASMIIAAAALATDTLGVVLRQPGGDFASVYAAMARGWLLWIVFTYWFFLAVLLAVRHSVTAAARQLRATQLEAAVATAQLAALRTQLHPHFLFNALNSIAALIAEEPRAAQKMIARLGELLRSTLADGSASDWTLRRELELLQGYTAIEEVRFGDRLKVHVRCEREALSARVPVLLLLPLVENAILHGIQPSLHGGTVEVAACREDGWLNIDVRDDGVGFETPDGGPADHVGIGLANTRERLAKRFGENHHFRIAPVSPRGTGVHIAIPWTAAPAGSAHVPAA